MYTKLQINELKLYKNSTFDEDLRTEAKGKKYKFCSAVNGRVVCFIEPDVCWYQEKLIAFMML